MGSGIAQVMATAGYEVVMQDLCEAFVKKGMAAIGEEPARECGQRETCRVRKGGYCQAESPRRRRLI